MERIIVPLGCGRKLKEGVPVSIAPGYPTEQTRERLDRAAKIWEEDKDFGMVLVGGQRATWANENIFPIPDAWIRFNFLARNISSHDTYREKSFAIYPKGFDFVTELIAVGEIAKKLERKK